MIPNNNNMTIDLYAMLKKELAKIEGNRSPVIVIAIVKPNSISICLVIKNCKLIKSLINTILNMQTMSYTKTSTIVAPNAL